MKKTKPYFILSLLLILFSFLLYNFLNSNDYGQESSIRIKDTTWQVEIAETTEEKALGLSNRPSLGEKEGLLFPFDYSKKQAFWMKDMLIPIDMIFIDENWQVVLIESKVEPNTFPKIFGNSVSSKYVLEINAGEAENFNVELGDKVIFVNK